MSPSTGQLNGTLFPRQVRAPECRVWAHLVRDLRAHRARGRKAHLVRDLRAHRARGHRAHQADSQEVSREWAREGSNKPFEIITA